MTTANRRSNGARDAARRWIARAGISAVLLGSSVAASVLPAGAQGQQAASATTGCTPRPGRLGVSRVVEIDTARGPRFGHQQYKEFDFLREGEVVLTFDDGPLRRHSRNVLEALAAHCTQATFYMVGQMALVDPDMVKEIARAGHTVAIHTWSHRNLKAVGTTNAIREIELGISAVQRALGQPVAPFFRFPYLADSPAMLSHLTERRFAVFSIDVDSRDFRTQDPRTMQRTVIGALQAKGKGILLFHDIQTSTARGIAGVLDELASRGFKVVHTIPKAPATTVASYDAMAEAEAVRRNRVAATNPMAQRSVVWPMATPPGVPVEQYRPEAVVAPAGRPPARQGSRVAPASASGGAAAAGGPATLAVPARPPEPQQQVQPAPAPSPRPEVRGPLDEPDWRRSVFGQ